MLLVGSMTAAAKRKAIASLADGTADLVIGTHALIEDSVIFADLGLAVIDEQHRFGAAQRSSLAKKGRDTHILTMSATPIPRTLAMVIYCDTDVSVIDEMPPGRKPVQTIHATEGRRGAMYNFMRDQIALGRQVFVVYPLIFETEKVDYQSLEEASSRWLRLFHSRLTRLPWCMVR